MATDLTPHSCLLCSKTLYGWGDQCDCKRRMEERLNNVGAAVMHDLEDAGVDMGQWKKVDVLHLHGACKTDPLNQYHLLALKAFVDGQLLGQCVKTSNNSVLIFVTDRLITGLVRVIKDEGLQPICGAAHPETTV